MSDLERFGVSMDGALLNAFDELIRSRGYRNRSEAIRDIIRDYLVSTEWEDSEHEVVGTLTVVYDHARHDLSEKLTALQHEHHERIVCSTHVHIDEHNCLEIVVLRGPAGEVRRLADELMATRGVKHAKLVSTTTGREIV